jgi:N-acetylglucosaminyl-diphospho-decaprenol L-rhamnosyltransferase
MISIVIITMNTKDLLSGLLSSIEADSSIRTSIKETIVVDNGSEDGTDAMIDSQFPWVVHIKNRENKGFAAAVNIGFSYASGEIIFLLNSDTRLIPGESEKMLRFLEMEGGAGVAGPQLVYEDMRSQRSFAQRPSLFFELVPRSLAALVRPEKYGTKGQGIKRPLEVDTLIGAALMIRQAAFASAGGFDERFFFFLEETDFCLQVALRSWKVFFFPETRLVHLQGKTVSRRWVAGRIEYAISLYKFLRKYHGAAYVAAFTIVKLLKTLFFLVPVTVLPFFWTSRSIRRKYRYYSALFLWHLRGCPEGAGLRPNPRARKVPRG